jgi:hypothetical protein
VTWEEAAAGTVRGGYGKVKATFIGREALIRNKLATPRAKDKGDFEELRGALDDVVGRGS